MKTVQTSFSRLNPWVMGAVLTGLLSACGSPGVPSVAAPSVAPDSQPSLPAQSWLDAPRIPAPAGVHQAAFGSVSVGAAQTTILALLKMSGQPDNVAFEMDSCPTHTRWTLSTDANTLTRQVDCNGTAQFAVLHRATTSSYIGYYSTLYSNGTVSFGPFRMTRRYANQTGLSPEWVAEWADSPQSNNSAPLVITADGVQQGYCTATVKFSFVDVESQLERLGNCGSGATAASLSRVNTSNVYAGFYVGFDAADVPTGLGAFALRRPAGAGLSGTWPSNWGGASIQGATKTSITVDGQGVEGCTQWKLSGDSSTLLRDFSSCGNSEGVAELHRMPGTNTYAGFYSHYDKVAKQFSMGPFQVKLSNLTLPGDPPLTAGVTWNPNTRLLHKSSGLSLSSFSFDQALNCGRFNFSSSSATGNAVLGRVEVGSLIASDTNMDIGGPYIKVNSVLGRTASTLEVCGQEVALNSFITAGKLDLSAASATAWNSSVGSVSGQTAYTSNFIPSQTRIFSNYDRPWDDAMSDYTPTAGGFTGQSAAPSGKFSAQAVPFASTCPTKPGSTNSLEDVRTMLKGTEPQPAAKSADKSFFGQTFLCTHLSFDNARFVASTYPDAPPVPGGGSVTGNGFGLELDNLNVSLLTIQTALPRPVKLPNFSLTGTPIGSLDQFGFLVVGRAGFEKLQIGFRPSFSVSVTPGGFVNKTAFQAYAKGKMQLEGLAAGLWFFQIPDRYLKAIPVVIPTPIGPLPTTFKPGMYGYPIYVGKGGFSAKQEFEVSLSASSSGVEGKADIKPVTTQFGSQGDNMTLLGVTVEPHIKWEVGTLGAFLPSESYTLAQKNGKLAELGFRMVQGLPEGPVKTIIRGVTANLTGNERLIERLLSKGLFTMTFSFRAKLHAKMFSMINDELKAQGINPPRPLLNTSLCLQPVIKLEALPAFNLPITFEGDFQGNDVCVWNKGYSWVDLEGSATKATAAGDSTISWTAKSTSEVSDIPGAPDAVAYFNGDLAPNFARSTVESTDISKAWLFANTRRHCLLYQVDKVNDNQDDPTTKFKINAGSVKATGTGAECNTPFKTAVKLAPGQDSALYRVVYFSEFSDGHEKLDQLRTAGFLNPENNFLFNNGVFGVWGYKDIKVSKTEGTPPDNSFISPSDLCKLQPPTGGMSAIPKTTGSEECIFPFAVELYFNRISDNYGVVVVPPGSLGGTFTTGYPVRIPANTRITFSGGFSVKSETSYPGPDGSVCKYRTESDYTYVLLNGKYYDVYGRTFYNNLSDFPNGTVRSTFPLIIGTIQNVLESARETRYNPNLGYPSNGYYQVCVGEPTVLSYNSAKSLFWFARVP